MESLKLSNMPLYSVSMVSEERCSSFFLASLLSACWNGVLLKSATLFLTALLLGLCVTPAEAQTTASSAAAPHAANGRPDPPTNLRIVSSIPASLFGLTVLNFSNLSPSMRFGTTRSWDAYPGLDWSEANPSAGTYKFTDLDTFIAANQARGSDIIYTFGRTPLWASSKPSAPGPYGPGQCAPPANVSAWDNYVRAIATHAAGRIKYWELWNEPDDAHFYCGDIPTMVTMAQHASRIIKEIDPSALILSPAVTGGPGPAWLASFLSLGGTASVDVIAFHGYWSANAEDVVNVISTYTTVMAANGAATKPMWDTESSWAGFGNLATPDNSRQIGFIAKDYLLHWSQGVSRFVWYAYDGGLIWGGLWSAGTGESPAVTSYKETYRWMVGALLTTPCAADQTGIWTCTLSREGGYSGEVVWISDKTGSFVVPMQYTVYRDLGGEVHTITNHTITVGDQPVLLENADLGVM
jgi:polysaccharide biosynthesis protein PslG